MQCMLAVAPRFLGPDNTPLVVLNLSEQYPTMELQGIVPEVLKKIVTTYDMVSSFLYFYVACLGKRRYLKITHQHNQELLLRHAFLFHASFTCVVKIIPLTLMYPKEFSVLL